MASMNRVMLLGNLTRDVEMKYTPKGTAIAEFGLAMNKKWKDAEGNPKEKVCFVDCKVFGAQAEVAQKYLFKGSPVLIDDAELEFDQWEDQGGQKRSKHRVLVNHFTLVGARQDNGGSVAPRSNGNGHANGATSRPAYGTEAPRGRAMQPAGMTVPPDDGFGGNGGGDNLPPDDDIPF